MRPAHDGVVDLHVHVDHLGGASLWVHDSDRRVRKLQWLQPSGRLAHRLVPLARPEELALDDHRMPVVPDEYVGPLLPADPFLLFGPHPRLGKECAELRVEVRLVLAGHAAPPPHRARSPQRAALRAGAAAAAGNGGGKGAGGARTRGSRRSEHPHGRGQVLCLFGRPELYKGLFARDRARRVDRRGALPVQDLDGVGNVGL